MFFRTCLIFLILWSMGCSLNANIENLSSSQSNPGNKDETVLPTVSFAAATTLVSEAAGTVSVVVNLSQASSNTVSVPFVVSGSATSPGHYTIGTTSVTISSGSTSGSISIVLNNNSTYETSRTIILTIGTPTNAAAAGTLNHVVTIKDDDPAYSVTKTFPTNGSRLLSYIKTSNSSLPFYSQSDTACVGNETGRNGCFHAGDKLKVVVTGVTTCAGLVITDALQVFDWVCAVTSGTATFYSSGFKIGKGLADIINFSTNEFLENSITVTQNATPLGSSASSKWWNTTSENPIQVLPSSSAVAQTLGGYNPGTVFVVPTSTNSVGYNINQDQIAIVVKNNQAITYSGNVDNCNWSTGEAVSNDWKSLICVGSQKYIWIEGTFNADMAANLQSIVTLSLTKFSKLNKLYIPKSAIDATIYLYQSSQNILTDLSVQSFVTDYSALALEDAHYNSIIKAQFDNSVGTNYFAATYLYSSDNNILSDFRATQMFDRGLYIEGANNTLSRIFIASGGRGPTIDGARNTVSHLSSHKNNGTCLAVVKPYNTVNQVLCSVNSVGFTVQGTNNALFSQVAVLSDDYTLPFASDMAVDIKYTNNMLYSLLNGSACYVTNGTNPGLAGPACANQGTSDANWVNLSAANPMLPFVGQVVTNDIANTSDTAGSASFGSITDWINFDNLFRSWGTSVVSACTSGTCNIWDYRLSSVDTLIRNKSNNGSTANDAFVAGATCPAAVNGNKALTDQQTSANTFLINAWEIMNDGIGDDDGLCESNEACIYSPNFGAYQGEGDYKAAGACTFQNGTVSNVIMYAYPTNGG